MDTDTVEFMLNLNRNAYELRKYGLEKGLSTEEINSCIDKALETDNEIKESSSGSVTLVADEIGRACCQKVKILSKIILVIFIIVLCVTIVVYSNRTSRVLYKELSQNIRDVYSYDFNRFLRLLLLPLHNFFHIRAYYYAECLLPNPWFEPQRSCEKCEEIFEVAELERPHWPIVRRYCIDQQPFVVRANKDLKSVRFEDLVELYTKNEDIMDNSLTGFDSNDPDFTNIKQVFDLKTDKNLQREEQLKIKWTTSTMSSSQILRKTLFPRPHFIPNNFEVSLQKTLFINGPDSQPIEIGEFGMLAEVVFYVQVVKGTSEVDVEPQGTCGDYCSPLEIVLNEGDILVFEQHLWKIDIFPSDEKETSIILAGSFIP